MDKQLEEMLTTEFETEIQQKGNCRISCLSISQDFIEYVNHAYGMGIQPLKTGKSGVDHDSKFYPSYYTKVNEGLVYAQTPKGQNLGLLHLGDSFKPSSVNDKFVYGIVYNPILNKKKEIRILLSGSLKYLPKHESLLREEAFWQSFAFDPSRDIYERIKKVLTKYNQPLYPAGPLVNQPVQLSFL